MELLKINGKIPFKQKYKELMIDQYRFSDNRFIFTIDTTLGTGNTFTLPTQSLYSYNCIVDWGDNSTSEITDYNDADITHTYSSGGTYQIKITGIFQAFYFNNAGDKLKLVSIDNWGNIGILSAQAAFYGCSNLTTIPSGPLTWSSCTTIYLMFYQCSGLTGSLPKDFLKLLIDLTNAAQVWRGTNITGNIPSDYFRYNTKLINVSQHFYQLIGLSGNIPEDLFYYNKLIKDYSYVFTGTRNLVLPTRLFDLSVLNIVTTFINFLDVTSTTYSPTGTIQDIWNYTTATSTDAFDQCTAISNYADIPTAWK